MRSNFFVIFALLATSALTASIAEQSLKALSDADAAAKSPSEHLAENAIKGDHGYYGYKICEEALTSQYFRSMEFRPTTRPKLGTPTVIYFTAVANQQLTIIGLDVALKYKGIAIGNREEIFDPPHELAPGETYETEQKFDAFNFATGKFEGRTHILGPGGKIIGCVDIFFIISE